MYPAVVNIRKIQTYNMDHEPWVAAGLASGSTLQSWLAISSIQANPTITTELEGIFSLKIQIDDEITTYY
jgi:hypothetical protein